MTKNKIFFIISEGFYTLLLLAPIIIMMICAINFGPDGVDDMLSRYTGVFVGTDVYNAINGVIGADGVAPLLNVNSAALVDYIVYVVYVSVFRLLVDAFKFIPDMAHQFLHKLGGGLSD